MRDGYASEALVFKPSQLPLCTRSALLILIYGGGFVCGNNLVMAPVALDAVDVLNVTAVTISYRLAPEHPFPMGPQDVWDSLVWLASNAASLGADPAAGFIVGGSSAGANLAAVVTQLSMERPLAAPITGLWTRIPILLDDSIVPEEYRDVYLSREQNRKSIGLDEAAIKMILDLYKMDFRSAQGTPFSAAKPHVGMPPTYVQVAGRDPLRDDGLIYERILRANGVKTRLDVYPGLPHGNTNPTLKSSRKRTVDTIEGLGWLLGRDDVSRATIGTTLGISDF